jgi:hypothetical protein
MITTALLIVPPVRLGDLEARTASRCLLTMTQQPLQKFLGVHAGGVDAVLARIN